MVRIEPCLRAGTVATPVAPSGTPAWAPRKYSRQTPREIALHNLLCSTSRQRPPAMHLPSPAGIEVGDQPALQACLLAPSRASPPVGVTLPSFLSKKKAGVFQR